PVASRFPVSEAALELGLLGKMLGKPDATAILEKIVPIADTSNDPHEVARAARALRALGRFQEASAAYRDATGALPSDPSFQTGWGELVLGKCNKAHAV